MIPYNLPIAYFNDPLGMVGKLHVVGNEDDRVTTTMQFMENIHHFLTALAVQCAGGLVRQDHVAAVDQGSGDAHPLLLASRELVRAVVASVPEPEAREYFPCPRPASFFAYTGIDCRYFGVLGGGQVRHQVIALEDEAEILSAQPGQFIAGQFPGFLAVDSVAPLTGAVKAAKDIHQGRFPRAGCANDRHHFSAPDGQVDPLQHGGFLSSGDESTPQL